MEYGSEEMAAVKAVLNDRWLTMGPRTLIFEKEFSNQIDQAPCALVSNGSSALHLALKVLGCANGDEVILPSLTFAATANVAIQCGADCVFADIEDVNIPLISPEDIKNRITPCTRVIMPVHYAGFSANMDEIKKIVLKEIERRKKAGEIRPLYIVEDAAHAAGARDIKGRPLGSIGDIGAFSLFSNKNISAGEGGIITSSNEEFMDRIKILRSHGLTRQTWERHEKGSSGKMFLYDIIEPGYNYRPTEITAALAVEQLKKLSGINRKRSDLFKYAHEKIKKIPGITLPYLNPEDWGTPSYHILPILMKNREARINTAAALAEAGIQTSHHYRPVHSMTFYKKKYPGAGSGLKKTEKFAERELTLPLHPGLSYEDMDYIIKKLSGSTV
jgi:dTDP-4-amino-4,6-dideoxygalactose transaminase